MDHYHGQTRSTAVLHDLLISCPGQTTEYLAYSLLSQYASSGTIKSLVDKYDFYIFPVVNPDGTTRVVSCLCTAAAEAK